MYVHNDHKKSTEEVELNDEMNHCIITRVEGGRDEINNSMDNWTY